MSKKPKFSKQKILETVKNVLMPVDYVIFAYLFGSYATDTVWAMSDVDIAVYIDEKKVKDLFKTKLKLLGMIIDALKTDDVDSVVLNEATPVLKYEILTKGVLIFTKDERVSDEFYLRALKEFFDFKYILDKNYEMVKESLRKSKNKR